MTATFTATGIDLDAADIPIITDLPQAQGDVMFIPTRPSAKPGQPVPPEGVPVVRGENGGNTHLLLAAGPGVTWAPISGSLLDLGVITVPAGAVAYMQHPEHAGLALGIGAWICRRQREQADEIRRVAD